MRTSLNRLKAIDKAARKGSINLDGGDKRWRLYYLRIQNLVWERNLVDGCNIDVDFEDSHIGGVDIDYNLKETTITYREKYGETKKLTFKHR